MEPLEDQDRRLHAGGDPGAAGQDPGAGLHGAAHRPPGGDVRTGVEAAAEILAQGAFHDLQQAGVALHPGTSSLAADLASGGS